MATNQNQDSLKSEILIRTVPVRIVDPHQNPVPILDHTFEATSDASADIRDFYDLR